MPVTMLLAKLSLRGFSRFEPFIDMGCASLGCDPGVAAPTPPKPPKPPKPLKGVLLRSMAVVDRASLPEVDCSADVRLDVWVFRGEVAREVVAMSMGVAMFNIGSGSSKSSGQTVSSKSESRRVESP